MRFAILVGIVSCAWTSVQAQFAPAAGKPGSTALYTDSSIFVSWGTACSIKYGYMDIRNPQDGYPSVGDSTMALGKAGTNGTVSLGDSGIATFTLNPPVINGTGWDFALFENSFDDRYLELAFVEVSDDGVNFVRFPATSLTPDSVQVDGFGFIEPEHINNFAGKYRAKYGTPFDLEELKDSLDVSHITHIRIIDVVGSIDTAYATHDYLGNKVNDPFPTPFASSGFDLDALGIIHQAPANGIKHQVKNTIHVFPNPASDILNISGTNADIAMLVDMQGKTVRNFTLIPGQTEQTLLLTGIAPGTYVLQTSGAIETRQLITIQP